ncbi:MAG: hypothetical protein COV99_05895 [Bacteroidetes bacterium CG12_big_fil_rev_8_21_14_0_65_60_17]|nr:MAG: hypothetical protein COV99_05895 [Bacteroidetes bacterium CG12_big_fil_rev_8_21_14_0_65_60_17]
MPITSRIITLTTDFGLQDGYVASMKGVMLSLAPDSRLVDVTHEIPAQDVMSAAFVLKSAYRYFPEGTVHLAVVDPGVGSSRHAIALEHEGHMFVGPDNGLFSLVLGDQVPPSVVLLDQVAAWRPAPVSSTFHGRDIFAPVAARLASGLPLEDVGTRTDGFKRMSWALPISDPEGIRGWVVHIDRFGNCITNITRRELEQHRDGRGVKCYAGNTVVSHVVSTYSDVSDGEPVMLINSEELLEVAVHGGSAERLLGLHRGAPVNILFTEDVVA